MMFGIAGALTTFGGAIAATVFWHKKKSEVEPSIKAFIGPKSFGFVITMFVLMWIVPYGALILLPLGIGITLASPAGRKDWQHHKQPRIVFLSVFVVLLLCTSMFPVQQPRASESWGQPLFTENPNAPAVPASEQYTWLIASFNAPLDAVILQSMVIRTPYQYGQYHEATSMLQISSLFNLENSRLEQAIFLLDERVSTNLDPDEMNLDPLLVENKHKYPTDAGHVELDVRLYDLRSLALGLDPKGGKVGHVVIVADGRWGGEVDMLVIVRPITHSEIETDPFGERFVAQWLAA
jgi:hypothetical protein